MHRPIVALLACLLLTATGLGLLGVAATVTSAPVVAVATAPAEIPVESTPKRDAPPAVGPLAADVPMPLPDGRAMLRVARLTLAPGAVLAPVMAWEPTALVAESGAVGVRTRKAVVVGPGLDEIQIDTVLHRGDHLVILPGTVRTVRNTGPMAAVVLVMAIDPAEVPSEQAEHVPRR